MNFQHSFFVVVIALALGIGGIASTTGCNPSKSDNMEVSESSVQTNAGGAETTEAGADAEAAAARMKAEDKAVAETVHDFQARTKTKAHRKPAVAQHNVYIVQIGAFRVRENAEKLHNSLKEAGFPVIFREMNHSKNGALYLVRMEPTPNRQEADTMVQSLKEKTQLPAMVIVQADQK